MTTMALFLRVIGGNFCTQSVPYETTIRPNNVAMSTIVVGALLLLIGVFLYTIQPNRERAFRSIPGPKPAFLLGNVPELKREGQVGCHLRWMQQYGKLYKFYVGRQESIGLADPDMVKDVLVKHAKAFHDRASPPYLLQQHLMGIVFAKGTYWESTRKAVTPFFHGEKMHHYVMLMEQCADVLVKSLRKFAGNEEPIDLNKYIQAMTVNVIGHTAFGMDLGVQDDKESLLAQNLAAAANLLVNLRASAFVSMMGGPNAGFASQSFLKYIPYSRDRELHSIMEWLMRTGADLVHQKRNKEGGQEESTDLMTYLSRGKTKGEQRAFTDREIAYLASEFMLAGSDTTSNTVVFAVYMLASNPEKLAKMLTEIDAAKAAREISRANATIANYGSTYPYVDLVIKETVRMMPSVPIITRVSERDCTIAGQFFPKGVTVYIPIYAMHRDPNVFQDPERFIPERFDPDSGECDSRHPYAYIPFGGGAHACLGSKFAFEEARLMLVKLYEHFAFQIDESKMGKVGTPLETETGVVMKSKKGLWVRIYNRVTKD